MTLRSLMFRFREDQEGAVLPLVGVVSIALIGATGFGIDTARLVLMHSSLQRAIDAGALSTVAKLDKATIDAQLRKFTVANFAEGQIGATIDSLTWSLSSDDKTLTVDATASAPTTFMNILGVETMNTSAQTVIERSTTGLELALVLDNTGSMSGSPLTSLKSAANTLVDTLFGDDAVAENLYVGIVPFSQTVNVGKSHTDWLASGALSSLDWGPTSWGGCVEGFSSSTDDMSDTVPSTKPLTPYYWEDDDYQNDWISTKGNSGKKTYDSNLSNANGPNKYCPAEVTRLTPKKATIKSAISAMNAVGNTHINFGAVWGWRILSPKWRGIWGGDMATYELPLDYGAPHMSKAAVIMTDGENTMSSSIYTAYGWLSEKKLGTSNEGSAVTQLNNRLSSVCTSMKNAGIIIYTIAFNGPDTSTQKLMRECATQDAFYFNSPTNAALQSAFQQIGDSLSNLRISK
ncbi:Flp pilus assembly protein TadG [Pseudorhizobium tarimense]|uniref:Flp pilus assembly protein TadG n=1 Tax=Pseudorhizobium tarimense TaxID=1079109 RepID=A0ABV2HC88_9HYPH|nr:TadE/TadG family type IV pilus assembly protein [Pseudorhizobium tarimense]MCJ8521182.1 TadE/TadG family protein [Pseudorhizobium tarimense]